MVAMLESLFPVYILKCCLLQTHLPKTHISLKARLSITIKYKTSLNAMLIYKTLLLSVTSCCSATFNDQCPLHDCVLFIFGVHKGITGRCGKLDRQFLINELIHTGYAGLGAANGQTINRGEKLASHIGPHRLKLESHYTVRGLMRQYSFHILYFINFAQTFTNVTNGKPLSLMLIVDSIICFCFLGVDKCAGKCFIFIFLNKQSLTTCQLLCATRQIL